MLEIISKLGPLVAAVSAAIAAIGAAFVYRQYHRQQNWRRGDLAAALLNKLGSDDELAFACLSLDWGTGPLIVPERYRPLLRKFNHHDEAVIDHDTNALALALEPQLNDQTRASAQGLIYRHTFDKLFNHLNDIGRLVESDQLDVRDLDGLTYWLKRISEYGYPPPRFDADRIFQLAIYHFDYSEIPRLARRLNVNNWSVYDECFAAHQPRKVQSKGSE
jgi:hypothetical protein